MVETKAFLQLVAAAIGGFLILMGIVVGTGSTFGQRCAKVYQDPAEIDKCVVRLQKSQPIKEEK